METNRNLLSLAAMVVLFVGSLRAWADPADAAAQVTHHVLFESIEAVGWIPTFGMSERNRAIDALSLAGEEVQRKIPCGIQFRIANSAMGHLPSSTSADSSALPLPPSSTANPLADTDASAGGAPLPAEYPSSDGHPVAPLLSPSRSPAIPGSAQPAPTPSGASPQAQMEAAMASALLKQAGITVTLCEMPRVGDGILATELARCGVAQVHGLAVNRQEAAAARRTAEEAHLLGMSVSIETGSPAALPLAEWAADLVLVVDATDWNLADISAIEISRVLAPYRGVALIGNPGGQKSGLSEAALTRWVKGIDGIAEVHEAADGLWATVRMPPLKGGDDWTHFMHGADGNLVSQDTAFSGAPLSLQWTGAPFIAGNWDVNVVSAGRLFTAQCSSTAGPDPFPSDMPYELLARNLYNGSVMWTRPLPLDAPVSFGESASLVVATPQAVFLKDAGSVLELQPETGVVIRRLVATEDPQRTCLWLLESDGVLLALTGPVQTYGHNSDWDWKKNDTLVLPPNKGGQALTDPLDLRAINGTRNINDLFYADAIIAWDVENGKKLWQFSDHQIDPCSIAIVSGRVYLYANAAYAACLDLRLGTQLWKTPAPIKNPDVPGIGYIDAHMPAKAMKLHRHGGIATKGIYLISYLPHRQCQAFSTNDGHLLWERMEGPSDGLNPFRTDLDAASSMLNSPLVIDSKIIQKWSQPSHVFDLESGNPVLPAIKFSPSGCGRFTGTAGGLLFAQCGEIFSIPQDKQILHYNVKGACGYGQVVADGVLIKGQDNGDCDIEWRDPVISRSRTPASSKPDLARLDPGQALSPTLASASEASDWATYRNDNTRKNSSSALISAQVQRLWTFDPAHAPRAMVRAGDDATNFSRLGSDFQLLQASGALGGYLPDDNSTSAVAIGDRIWFGLADGAIVCLDRATGAEQWRFWTAGRIMASPTWWHGRLYAGSCDGWLYCLDAAQGSLFWRYRVAPEQREVMIWQHLSSAWPIMANVLVEDGVVYAGAGAMGQLDGVALSALDALTGQPRWEKRFDQGDGGPSGAGQLAFAQGRLYWRIGRSGILTIDPATGNSASIFDRRELLPQEVNGNRTKESVMRYLTSMSEGTDIGILPGGWVAFGGRMFNTPLNATALRSGGICLFYGTPTPAGTDANQSGVGAEECVCLPNLHDSYSLPTWDDKGLLLSGKCPARKPGDCPALIPSFASMTADFPSPDASTGIRIVKSPLDTGENQLKTLTPLLSTIWYTEGIMAKNAIVFITVTHMSVKNTGHLLWQLMSFNRDDSSLMWATDLPEMPVVNGLAMDREGDIVAPLIDGRVVCIGAAK